jgi:hypothetical protein
MTLQEAISRLECSYFIMWVRQYEKGEADGFVGGNVSCNALAEVFLAAKKYAADQPNVVRPGHECLCMNCGQTHDDGDPSRTGTADQQSEVPK